MSNQLMRKECKICGTRFGREIMLCRNCGSADTQLVVQENIGLPEAVNTGNREVDLSRSGKKSLRKKWKKIAVISASVLVGGVLLLSVAFQQLLRWADKIVQMENLGIEETIKLDETLLEALERTERLYGTEWKNEVFPLLNQLYDQNQYNILYNIYADIKEQDINKPIAQWEHYLFARELYDIYDIVKVQAGETAGEQIKEWQYVNILIDYFEFEDFENRTNLTEEEKEKLMPFVIELRKDAKTRWELNKKEWEELRKSVVSEYNEVIYEEAERFVESWMEKNGYTHDGNTFEAELIHSTGMDEDTWEKKFYPKLDEMYEQKLDEELYNACNLVYFYDRTLAGWQHEDYFEMLGEYFKTESIWMEEIEAELVDYQYTQLLYSYLVFKHWETNKSLSTEEMERLKLYRERLLREGGIRWKLTEEEWQQINETIATRGGYVYYFDVADFIEQWMKGNK